LPATPAAITSAPTNVGGYTFAETPAASGDLEELWSRLVEAAGRASPFVRTYLLEAHPVSFERGLFTIGFDPEFDDHRGLVDNSRNHTMLQTKLAELGHAGVQFKFIKAEAPAGRVRVTPASVPTTTPIPAPAATSNPAKPATTKEKAPAPVTFNKDDFKNDPLIQKALEVFKGQIVEVRA
jgi:DNA polymerase-3 subunit gamma/tau